MRIMELTVSLSRRRNLGNYEHDEQLVAVKVAFEGGDSLAHRTRELTQELNRILDNHGPKGMLERAKEVHLSKKTEPGTWAP